MAETRIAQYVAAAARDAPTVVSLHSHTYISKESLGFLPEWATRTPLVGPVVRRLLNRYQARAGRPVDFARAYWCPPPSPIAVVESEVAQIANRFGTATPLVSITDHDTIAANLGLAAVGLGASCPVSTEWTVPFRDAIFHLGVHNMPPDLAAEMTGEFQRFTANPVEARLADLLGWVHAMPSVLVVLNHPLWNARDDRDQNDTAVADLLGAYGRFLHALEMGGYRGHAENNAVVRMGRDWDLPVLAGGDRHGHAPNALLNVTSASTFDEFVQEVRYDRRTHVVVMPEYQEHPATRVLEVVSDVLRQDPVAAPGQQHWTERVFIIREDGRHQPLEEVWMSQAPFLARAIIATATALSSVAARQALQLGLRVENEGLM
jgi:hypothetical protein